MTAWALLWQLVKHCLHGRGRDEVHTTVGLGLHGFATGPVHEFTWAGDKDATCHIEARGVLEDLSDALDEVPS